MTFPNKPFLFVLFGNILTWLNFKKFSGSSFGKIPCKYISDGIFIPFWLPFNGSNSLLCDRWVNRLELDTIWSFCCVLCCKILILRLYSSCSVTSSHYYVCYGVSKFFSTWISILLMTSVAIFFNLKLSSFISYKGKRCLELQSIRCAYNAFLTAYIKFTSDILMRFMLFFPGVAL